MSRLKSLGNKIKSTFKKNVKYIKRNANNSFSDTVSDIATKAKFKGKDIKYAVEDAGGVARNALKKAKSASKEAIPKASKKARSLIDKGRSKINNVASNINNSNTGKDFRYATDDIGDGIKSAINKVKNWH